MAEITVRAIDSALAMEEIQKRLGDEALIISTKRVAVSYTHLTLPTIYSV